MKENKIYFLIGQLLLIKINSLIGYIINYTIRQVVSVDFRNNYWLGSLIENKLLVTIDLLLVLALVGMVLYYKY